MNGWGKVKQAARYAGVSERTFRDWLKDCSLKHSRLRTGTILIRFSDIDSFLEGFAVDDNQLDWIVDDVMEGL
jgi:excisionase family DNA binding protein